MKDISSWKQRSLPVRAFYYNTLSNVRLADSPFLQKSATAEMIPDVLVAEAVSTDALCIFIIARHVRLNN